MMTPVSEHHPRLIVSVRAIAVLYIALFFWYLNATIIQPPFADMYSVVQQYLSYRTDGGWWSYLWTPHAEHRPVFLRLLAAFDIEVFSGVSYPFVVASAIAHVGTAWLLWRECRAGIAGPLGVVIGYVGLMLVLTSVSAVVIAIPIMNNLIHGLAFVVLAIVLFERLEGDGDERATSGRRVAALLVACLVPFADAVGWAVWPILFWIAWRAGAERQWLWTIAGVGTALLLVYTRGLSLPFPLASDPTVPALGLAEELAMRANYLFVFLGLPWTRSPDLHVFGRSIGALLCVTAVGVVCWRGLYRAPSGRLERIAIALIMFSLAAAVLATIGRAGDPILSGVLVPVRYSVLLIPLHVGLLWVASPWLGRLWSHGRSLSVSLSAVGVCAGLLAQHVVSGQAAMENAERIRATIARFQAGQSDADMAIVIGDDLDKARRELADMRRAGVYVGDR
ncbi:MAG: hypothetical protein O2930_06835 [Acidobacteria bacterium]|nr:hypothetical protein [Acidobacteriota bacterium]